LTATDPLSSDWNLIDQPMVDRFADAIGDHQFIHTDPVRAKAETGYGGTIVHGFFLLSLLTRLSQQALPATSPGTVEINYGFDKVRFVSPVPVGARLRGHFTLLDSTAKGDGTLKRYAVSLEIEGASRPALVAEWLVLLNN
jgi:acyl dehydratase